MEYKPVAEMSFLQAPFDVDLVETGLRCKTSVLCVAKDASKLFIAVQIIQEVTRKSLPGKSILVISENPNGYFITEFIRALELQTDVKTFLELSTNLMILTPSDAVYLLKSNCICLGNVNLVILDDCHLVTQDNHPYLSIIDQIKSHDHFSQPIITGLSSQLCLSSPALLQITLDKMESVFGCHCSISRDLVAMNRFGVQPYDSVITYSSLLESANDEIKQLTNILGSIVGNLLGLVDPESPLVHIRRQCIVCFKILECYGSSGAIFHVKSILKEISKLKKKLKNELERPNLEFCEAQLNSMLKYSKTDEPLDNLNHPVKDIVFYLASLKTEAILDSTTNTPSLSSKPDLSAKVPNKNDIKSTCKVTNSGGCHGDSSVSIILCQFDKEAAVLNFLLNKLANSNPELSYIRSKYVPSSMIKKNDLGLDTDADAEKTSNEDIQKLIFEGRVNVITTCQDIEDDIHLKQCKQVIRIGVPEDYASYLRVKRIPKTKQAELVIVEDEEVWSKEGRRINYNVFKEIEGILAQRCLSFQPAIEPNALSDVLDNIDPLTKEGPCIDAKCAVAIINRYCKSFPNDGFSCPVPRSRYRVRVIDQDDQIHVVSRLYLPRHSPVFWPFKSTVTIPKEQATAGRLKKAHIEITTSTALQACKALHEAGELNDNLEPTFMPNKITMKLANEKCAAEVADGGKGEEGSVKRRRAYKKKFATVLMNNLAVAGEAVYVYRISITLNQLASRESTVRSYNMTSSSDICLGIISRNRLPKVPSFLLFPSPGQSEVSIIECTGKISLTPQQISLIQRFHQYIYTNIININGNSGEQCFTFEPEKQSFGCYVVLLEKPDSQDDSEGWKTGQFSDSSEIDKNDSRLRSSALDECLDGVAFQDLTLNSFKGDTPHQAEAQGLPEDVPNESNAIRDIRTKSSRIAFDFLEKLEQQIGDFTNPRRPPPTETRNFDLFENRVVTAAYMAKPTSYFVNDVCYHRNPLSPFPDPCVAATFKDYYKMKYDVDLYDDQPLLCVDHIRKRMNILIPRHQDAKGNDLPLPDINSKRRQKSQIYLIPQLCSIHPLPASLWQEMLDIPSILYRLEGLLVAEELRQTISFHTGVGSLDWPEGNDLPLLATGESVGENCAQNNFCMNSMKQNNEKQIEGTKNRPGPSSTLLLRALTCLGACDVFSHERLEIYGDSLIKHTVSLNLLCKSPFSNVGKISFLRGLRVSNKQLFYLGRALDIPSYIWNLPFKPLINWHPHGFNMLPSVKPQGRFLELNSQEQEIDLRDTEDEKTEDLDEECEKPVPSVLIDSQNHVVMSDKIIADTTEALIGAYLVTCGFNDTLRVMKWIGLDVKLKEEQDDVEPKTNSVPEQMSEEKRLEIHDEFFENSLRLDKEILEVEFKEVEDALGYSFRNKTLLLQAFTHASYPRDFNHVRTSYENLEFLGDALLDYLVTRYLYHTQRTLSPGALTDLRAAVVNSYSFAFLAVKYGFHKHLRSLSPAVFRIVNKFVVILNDSMTKKMRENPNQIFSSVFIPMDDNYEDQEGVEVPKVLADLFEAVIGAVFLDCGKDEEKTWDVVYPLLQATLDHYSIHLPLSPVRQLQEMLPNAVSMLSMDRSIAGRYTCTVLVQGVGKFKGTGRSWKIARSTAAQRALAQIQSNLKKKQSI